MEFKIFIVEDREENRTILTALLEKILKFVLIDGVGGYEIAQKKIREEWDIYVIDCDLSRHWNEGQDKNPIIGGVWLWSEIYLNDIRVPIILYSGSEDVKKYYEPFWKTQGLPFKIILKSQIENTSNVEALSICNEIERSLSKLQRQNILNLKVDVELCRNLLSKLKSLQTNTQVMEFINRDCGVKISSKTEEEHPIGLLDLPLVPLRNNSDKGEDHNIDNDVLINLYDNNKNIWTFKCFFPQFSVKLENIQEQGKELFSVIDQIEDIIDVRDLNMLLRRWFHTDQQNPLHKLTHSMGGINDYEGVNALILSTFLTSGASNAFKDYLRNIDQIIAVYNNNGNVVNDDVRSKATRIIQNILDAKTINMLGSELKYLAILNEVNFCTTASDLNSLLMDLFSILEKDFRYNIKKALTIDGIIGCFISRMGIEYQFTSSGDLTGSDGELFGYVQDYVLGIVGICSEIVKKAYKTGCKSIKIHLVNDSLKKISLRISDEGIGFNRSIMGLIECRESSDWKKAIESLRHYPTKFIVESFGTHGTGEKQYRVFDFKLNRYVEESDATTPPPNYNNGSNMGTVYTLDFQYRRTDND